MKESIPLQQAELHAYVDEQLSAEARHRVEEYLDSHPEALAEVSEYQQISEQLKQLYQPILEEPIPPAYLQPKVQRRWWPVLRTSAAAGFLFAAGLSLGLFLGVDLELVDDAHLTDDDHVVSEAAMAYAIYSPEIHHPVEVKSDQEEHLVNWLSKRMGQQIRAPKLDALGMHLLGGRLLSTEDGPGALFMYENSQGKRVILYACVSPEQKATAFQFARQDGISVFYWFDDSLSYAVAGQMPRKDLHVLAQAVYRELIL